MNDVTNTSQNNDISLIVCDAGVVKAVVVVRCRVVISSCRIMPLNRLVHVLVDRTHATVDDGIARHDGIVF